MSGSIVCALMRRLAGLHRLADFDQPSPAGNLETDDIARRQVHQARRQREFRALTPGPQILQPDLGAPLDVGIVVDHREVGMRTARRAADQPARRHRRAVIVGAAVAVSDRDFARQFGFLCAREPRRRAVGRQHQVVFGEFGNRRATALTEAQDAALLRRVESIGKRQRLDRRARRHWPIDDVAFRAAFERRGVGVGYAGIGKHGCNQRIQRRKPEPAGQPMTGLPVPAVGPNIRRGGKCRIGPRIPGPQMDGGSLDHALAIERGDRVLFRARAERGIERRQCRLQIAALHEVVPPAAGKIGNARVR